MGAARLLLQTGIHSNEKYNQVISLIFSFARQGGDGEADGICHSSAKIRFGAQKQNQRQGRGQAADCLRFCCFSECDYGHVTSLYVL
jgi:hypothetical protein